MAESCERPSSPRFALDKVGRLARREIEQLQFSLGRTAPASVTRREQAQHSARTAYKLRGLHRAGLRREHGVKRSRANENWTSGDILDDDPGSFVKSAASGWRPGLQPQMILSLNSFGCQAASPCGFRTTLMHSPFFS